MISLAVVIPTLNEAGNIRPLVGKLDTVLAGIDWEVIFVDDDSIDGTSDLIRSISQEDPRVRVIQRIGRRGLASACIEGMLATAAPYLAVMDADLQHDETVLPTMYALLKEKNLDVVVASRNLSSEGMGKFSAARQALSRMGARFSRIVLRCDLTDPMSGFFLIDRRFLNEVSHRLSGIGFKILVDLVASVQRPIRVMEVPYVFGKRLHGSSKLDLNVGIEYLMLLADKMIGDWIPVRYVLFGIVGLVGVFLHLVILWLGINLFHLEFSPALLLAIYVVMVINFIGNNQFTYRDRRLRGRALITGGISFCIACTVGALTNYKLTEMLTNLGFPRYPAAFCGAFAGSVWNYAVTATFTWRGARKRRSR